MNTIIFFGIFDFNSKASGVYNYVSCRQSSLYVLIDQIKIGKHVLEMSYGMTREFFSDAL